MKELEMKEELKKIIDQVRQLGIANKGNSIFLKGEDAKKIGMGIILQEENIFLQEVILPQKVNEKAFAENILYALEVIYLRYLPKSMRMKDAFVEADAKIECLRREKLGLQFLEFEKILETIIKLLRESMGQKEVGIVFSEAEYLNMKVLPLIKNLRVPHLFYVFLAQTDETILTGIQEESLMNELEAREYFKRNFGHILSE